MSFNIGLNVVEVDGRAAPSIQAAPTSVTGFVIRAQRGILGKVVRVTNWSQFTENFGAYMDGAYGAHAVRGFFDNGGTTAYITRVYNTTPGTATAASLTSNEGPWAVSPGSALVINTNLPGGPFNVAFNASGAILSGDGGPFNLDDGAGVGTTIGFTVNGVVRGPYQFEDADFVGGLGAATVTEVAAVLNREFGGIQAWVEGGGLRVRTDRQGTSASLEATGSAAAELGLDAGVAGGSGSVANLDAVTPAEAVALIGAALAGAGITVVEDDGRIVITHPNSAAGETLQVDPASAPVAAVFGFDTVVHEGTDGDPGAEAAASTLDLGGALTVTAGYRGQPDPGAWGANVSVEVAANALDPALFDLLVYYNGRLVETRDGLSMDASASNFVETMINSEFSGSKFITVEATGAANPAVTPATALMGGSNGTFAAGSAEPNAYAAAIDLFDLVDIQLLVCPESTDAVVVDKALTHCETKGDRMFIGHTPLDFDANAAKDNYSKDFKGTKRFGALYFPWIRVANPAGSPIWVPPSGHIAGVYARTERERGIWKAPAGNAALVNGALDVRFHITDVDHTDLVKNGSVNAVRYIAGQGIIIDSSRSLSTNPLWLYVNVRLLFNFVKSSLRNGLRWVVQEPNDTALWNKVKYNSVTPFLMGLWQRGAFGPGDPEDVFTVKIDAENNPPANIQQGLLTVEIFFYPSRPAETIIITVGQQEGAASASES